MLRSSKEGRKQASRFHAFPTGHPALSSRFPTSHHQYSRTASSSSSSSSVSQPQKTIARSTHPNASNKASSLRQSTIESDYDWERSSPLTDIDDGIDSTDGDSSNTTQMVVSTVADHGPSQEEGEVMMEEAAGDASVPGKKRSEDAAMPSFQMEVSPSRETTEEQSQSLSQGNSSSLSSPPTSHPEEDDLMCPERLAQHIESMFQEVFAERASKASLKLSKAASSIEERAADDSTSSNDSGDGSSVEEEEEGDSIAESISTTGATSKLESNSIETLASPTDEVSLQDLHPILAENITKAESRSQRVKVKSLKMKEAEETLALSPNSKKRMQAHGGDISGPSHQSDEQQGVGVQQSHYSFLTDLDFTVDSAAAAEATAKDDLNDDIRETVPTDGPLKRGRGRPRGSTKQHAIEKRASEMQDTLSASMASVVSAQAAQADSVEQGSTRESDSPDSQARRAPDMKDAESYLDKVKAQFPGQPDMYNRFLDLMKDSKKQSLGHSEIIDRVLSLFDDRTSLIQGFNTFLPTSFHLECSHDSEGKVLITITTPSGKTSRRPAGDEEREAKRRKKKCGSTAAAAKKRSSTEASQKRSVRQSEEVPKFRSLTADVAGKSRMGRSSLQSLRKSILEEDTQRKLEARKTSRKSGTSLEESPSKARPSNDAVTTDDAAESSAKRARAAWKRKSYLTSGLYSDDYKKDEASSTTGRKRTSKDIPESLARGTPRTRKAHQVSALPLPIDYGLNLLEQQRDFRLPYPIAQEIQEIRDKLEAKKKPPPYKHISRNQYFSRPRLEGELMICQCPPDGDCGDSCVNRLTECLCHPKHCPCGDRCTNIYFGKRKAVKTEVQWYGARGFGLKTLEPIKKGGFIDEYRGEVIDYNEAVRRIRDHYKDTGNYYFLMYDAPAGEMLDGGLKGNITRFANHSCDPNCKVQKWIVSGTGETLSDEYQVALFAERDIEAGEELTYDYGWSAFAAKEVSGEANSAAPEVCHCGAAKCSGFLGVKKSSATVASEPVTKVLKRSHKKKVKAVVESDNSKIAERSVADSSRLASTPTSSIKPDALSIASPTKASSASASASASAFASPTKTTPLKLNRKGLMERVLNGLISPGSTLTSLSSDDDISELGKSTESTLSSLDSVLSRQGRIAFSYKPLQRPAEPVSTEPVLGKRKRFSARGSSPIEVSSRLAGTSGHQDTKSAGKDKATPKTGRIYLKDRVIRVLVPEDEDEEVQPSLIVDGKRERKMSLKAAEFDNLPSEKYYNKRRATSYSSSGTAEAKRGVSVDDGAPARGKVAADKQVQSSPLPSGRLVSRVRELYHGLRNAQGKDFNIKDYPRGIIYYDRNGSQFDFDEHRMRSSNGQQGSMTVVYTKQELSDHMLKEWEALEPTKRKGRRSEGSTAS